MERLGILLLAVPVLLGAYAYLVYPALLWLALRYRQSRQVPSTASKLPIVTVSLPAHNEETSIGRTLNALLASDYPKDRLQIVVISDASTDRTDEIVRQYAERGVELIQLPERMGKTAAENFALPYYRGEIVVNTDATIRILPDALRILVAAFDDPEVGVASGRDLSVGDVTSEGNQGESGYVSYEMWVRSLETRLDSIVGASGSFYAIRRSLIDGELSPSLSRDFDSALRAKAAGFRAVSVDAAICLVPRTRSLQTEFRRKIRTMASGLATLFNRRNLLNPFRYGVFAWMLMSHKLIRWTVFPSSVLGGKGLLILATDSGHALAGLVCVIVFVILAVIALRWPPGKRIPFLFALPGFILVATSAGIIAWLQALRGHQTPIWEPTRRPSAQSWHMPQ
jgi:cellulose synthase/poly-beta-1,6-N-acetylglucosamine synthase-like glycosyltransferase